MSVEMLAFFELILRAAIRALGLTAVANVQIHLGMAVPERHVGLFAGAEHAALVVKVFAQEFYSRILHDGFRSDNLGQPMGIFRVASVDDIKERALDFFGDGAAAAAA